MVFRLGRRQVTRSPEKSSALTTATPVDDRLDRDALFTEEFFLIESHLMPSDGGKRFDYLNVPVTGGYIIAVSGEVGNLNEYNWRNNPDPKGGLTFGLWDSGSRATAWQSYHEFARFTIPFGSGFHRGGIYLETPLPNMNSAASYMLRIPGFTPLPDVKFTLVVCYEKRGT